MSGQWIAHDFRDEAVDSVQDWSGRTEIHYERLVHWIELPARKFQDRRGRHGKVTEHSNAVPRHRWLERWEMQAIVKFFHDHPLEAYRRLCAS